MGSIKLLLKRLEVSDLTEIILWSVFGCRFFLPLTIAYVGFLSVHGLFSHVSGLPSHLCWLYLGSHPLGWVPKNHCLVTRFRSGVIVQPNSRIHTGPQDSESRVLIQALSPTEPNLQHHCGLCFYDSVWLL